MIRGAVSADGVPTITLSIAGQDWPAIIDTGFNGDAERKEAEGWFEVSTLKEGTGQQPVPPK